MRAFVYRIIANTPLMRYRTTTRKSELISANQPPGRHSANTARPQIWAGVSHDINNNNNNNIKYNVYGAVIMAEPLREFTRFI